MDNNTENLLLRSFDDDLTSEEKENLNNALAASEALRLEAEEINILRQTVTTAAAQSFKPFFAERVTQKLFSERTEDDSFSVFINIMFRPVAVASAILIVIMLSYNAIAHHGHPMAGLWDTETVPIEQSLDPTYAWLGE